MSKRKYFTEEEISKRIPLRDILDRIIPGMNVPIIEKKPKDMDPNKFIGKRKIYHYMRNKFNLAKVNEAPKSPDYLGSDEAGSNYYDLNTKRYYVLSGGIWYIKR